MVRTTKQLPYIDMYGTLRYNDFKDLLNKKDLERVDHIYMLIGERLVDTGKIKEIEEIFEDGKNKYIKDECDLNMIKTFRKFTNNYLGLH